MTKLKLQNYIFFEIIQLVFPFFGVEGPEKLKKVEILCECLL